MKTKPPATLATLFTFFLLGCAHSQLSPPQNPAAPSQHPSTHSLVAPDLTDKISNVDIEWTGNIAGLRPTITGPSKDFLTNSDPGTVPALIGLLTDENRYIAAHVLLTHISEEQFEFTPGHWNDLRVEILADNVIIVPAGRQPRLIGKWIQWHAGKQNN